MTYSDEEQNNDLYAFIDEYKLVGKLSNAEANLISNTDVHLYNDAKQNKQPKVLLKDFNFNQSGT